MKKFVALIILLVSVLAMTPDLQVMASSPPGIEVTLHSQVDQVALNEIEKEVAVTTSVEEDVVADLEAPESTLSDVINVPNKGSGTEDWLVYALGVAVYIFYNFVVRLFPTSRSWTVGAMLYRLGNLFLKDRAANGGVMRIRNDTK